MRLLTSRSISVGKENKTSTMMMHRNEHGSQSTVQRHAGTIVTFIFLLLLTTTSLCQAVDNKDPEEEQRNERHHDGNPNNNSNKKTKDQHHASDHHRIHKPMLDPIPLLPEVTHKVYLDIQFDLQGEESKDADSAFSNTYNGRIVLGLFGTHASKMVENFKALCECTPTDGTTISTTAKSATSSAVSLCYRGSTFHRVIPNFMMQGGDITNHDGTGDATTIYGHDIVDESLSVRLNRKFLLASANKGYPDSNTSQFFITTVKTQWLNGKHVVFGLVLEGTDVVKRIEELGTNGGKPRRTITIVNTGVLELSDQEKRKRIPVSLPEPFQLFKTTKEDK